MKIYSCKLKTKKYKSLHLLLFTLLNFLIPLATRGLDKYLYSKGTTIDPLYLCVGPEMRSLLNT
jgi:hypothetical protein